MNVTLKRLAFSIPIAATLVAASLPARAQTADPYASSNETAATTESGSRTPGTVLDDSAITAKVKTSLIADDTTKARHIDVDTRDHVVSLSGTVSSGAERERAVEIARNTSGVKDVVDHLKLATH